jgi:uncharacterized protein YbjQ (UPF0145 family)
MFKKDFITTTSSFEGYRINKYLGIVDERIVVGAGFLSDLFASFTDIVGGRSGKYEQRIKELYDALLSGIQRQAYKKGANAIVGLKIDVDEISGKNVSMFMATAVGTAVHIKRDETLFDVKQENNIIESAIDAKDIEKAILSEKYNQKLLDANMNLKDKALIIEELSNKQIQIPIKILVDVIMQVDTNIYDTAIDEKQNQFQTILAYFSLYDSHDVARELNARLFFIKGDKKLFYFIYDNIVDVNYEEILPLIDSVAPNVLSHTVFRTLLKYKNTYTIKDVDFINKLIYKLKQLLQVNDNKENSNFPWECGTCGQKNSARNIYCKGCDRARNGLTQQQELLIKEIILHINKINIIINSKLKQND